MAVTFDDVVRIMKEAGVGRNIDQLSEAISLADQGLDSYDRMSLLFELEQSLDIEIPNDEAAKLKTPQNIVDYVNSK